MIKILAIGNSFSRNANTYLYDIAKSMGVEIKNVNLYIGGCPLSRHAQNIREDRKNYELDFDGKPTGFFVSVKEALESDNWDFITVQQASHESYDFEKYEPHLDFVADFVRSKCPDAKLGVHETWGYIDEKRLADNGFDSFNGMSEAILPCYKEAENRINADFFIPSGEVMSAAVHAGLSVHASDGFHAETLGCFMIGLAWFSVITGKSVTENKFTDIAGADMCDIEKAARITAEIVEKHKKEQKIWSNRKR